MANGKSEPLDRRIFAIIAVILGFLAFLLVLNLLFQYQNYRQAMVKAHDVVSLLVFARAWDAAVVKTSSLFFGFILLFAGALYVLRNAERSYSLSIDGRAVRGSLETSSPGLVMITLGVVLVGIVLASRSEISYSVEKPAAIASPVGDLYEPVSAPVPARRLQPTQERLVGSWDPASRVCCLRLSSRLLAALKV